MHTFSTPTKPPISIAILAGGRASRMNGVDKGLQQLHGQTLVERLLKQLKNASDDILISANRHLNDYQALFPACRIITDEPPDFKGPLGGIYSTLKHARHDYLLVIPCDLLQLPDDCIDKMLKQLLEGQLSVVYADINGQALYPFCLLHKSLLPSLENILLEQQYAVKHWLFSQHANKVELQLDAQMPINLNTLEHLIDAERFCRESVLDQLDAKADTVRQYHHV